jgi:Secretion system C-terminal sorting domain
MKLKVNPYRGFMVMLVLMISCINLGFSQDCSGLTASYVSTESRCTATGTLKITASGGSGTYNYKVQGPTTADFTSANLITGLQPGTYSIIVKDIISACTFEIDNVVIAGSYSDPRFGLAETDVTCMNGNDGKISVAGLTNGRAPFTYTVVAPSPSAVGTSNSTGTFTGLTPGTYSVQLTDSCGGIQTRTISIQNYTWSITSATVTQSSCTVYNAKIGLIDSKGNTNASGTVFNNFQYGAVNAPGDTSWFTTSSFNFDIAQKRTVTLVVKDHCGLVQSKNWSNTTIPSVQANATLSTLTCTGFTATIAGQQNLTSPTYCLFDNLGNTVSGQPCNTTGTFTNIPYGSYCIKITNTCYDTVMSRCFTQTKPVPAITGSVAISNLSCTSFTAVVTGQQNLTNPIYCIYDTKGNQVKPCNTSGGWNALPYGSYVVKVTDGCTGTVLTVNFTNLEKPKSVASTVTTNGFTCTTFNATVTGQTNLTTPQYCLVDSVGNPVTCNSTGIFNNLNFGSYCINITDACNDTTIKRCMTVVKPVPSGGSATISNKTCSGFTVTISGQANIFNGQYCLQDNLGNPVTGVPCNSTGIFNNIPYGSYCVKTTDGCTGGILTNCFTVTAPAPAVGPVTISNETCSGFTATLTGQQNLTNPSYCLFDNLNHQVGTCNTTGVFAVTGYGSYTIKTTDGCAGTVLTSNFSVIKPIPSVGAALNFTNQTCTTFAVAVTGQTNLTNPRYYLNHSNGVNITSNTNGLFIPIPYGSYCIEIVNGCADTTIERCFTIAAPATQMTITATPSCLFDASDLAIQVTSGLAPYTATVYDGSGNQIATKTSSSNSISFTGLAALLAGQQYKITVTSSCGTPATQLVTGQQSSLGHVYTITPKCPSSITLNGSADLQIVATTNLGTVNMTIIQKNYLADTISYSFKSGNTFTFNNLDAAVYVIAYTFSGCTTVINDTVNLPNYTFPSLAQSGAYQCDNNSFSVGAAVTGGMAPYTYQVIGSVPSTPSINSVPQSNPVFNINNGAQYSLVRLRAIDACGNATLNDVSILPLANTIVTSTSNCIHQSATLSTDVVANATYAWYQKANMSSTDSVLVGTGPTYTIPAIGVSDTGVYVNRMSVNSGCLTRISYFHLDGMCNGLFVLPTSVSLQGQMLTATANQLNWNVPAGENNREYVIERMDGANGNFVPVGTLAASASQLSTSYSFVDNTNGQGTYFYRLRIINIDNTFVYTNTVMIKSATETHISVFPNPASDVLNISIPGNPNQRYNLTLFNVAGQLIFTADRINPESGPIIYYRDPKIKAGYYFLKINDAVSGSSKVFKIKFE